MPSSSQINRYFFYGVVILGLAHAVASRHTMNPDGISYLEIGQRIAQGDWSAAINGYWSPLYSLLLGTAFFIFHPSLYWEATLIHSVNFLIYIGAFFSFRWFINTLTANYDQNKKLLKVLMYTIFLVSSLSMITLRMVTPDMLVALIIYVVLGIILRIKRNEGRWGIFALFGILLGLGYLTKAALFPMAFIFLSVGFFAAGNWRKALPRVILSLFVFLLMATPYVYLLSREKNRLTFSDAGRLNYAWFINDVTHYNHWQGGGDAGMPVHSTRKISDSPDIYEFGDPVWGTYPPWYDPTYWYEGVQPHFNFLGQLKTVFYNIEEYYKLFLRIYGIIISGLLFLFFATGDRRKLIKLILREWAILVPALAGLGMYILVAVRDRYAAPFSVLLWVGIFAGISSYDHSEVRKYTRTIIIAIIVVLLFQLGLSSINDSHQTLSVIFQGENSEEHVQWQIAEGLRESGLKSGDEIGIISQHVAGFGSYWAYLAGVRIVAELPPGEVNKYWFAGDETKNNVLKIFKKAGVRAVVMEQMQSPKPLVGWQKLGDTQYYIYLFK